jgi:hypothetical protein
MSRLGPRQEAALRTIAECGDGVAIDKRVARSLEERGLARIVGDSSMVRGVTMALTTTGCDIARESWISYARGFVKQRGESSKVAMRALARLDRTEAQLRNLQAVAR